VAQQLGAGIHLLDIAQHARPESQRIERHAVAQVSGFRLGAAHQVVPGLAREVAPRRRDELVQNGVLQLLVHSNFLYRRHTLPAEHQPKRRLDRIPLPFMGRG
jgi:hypothetical protein